MHKYILSYRFEAESDAEAEWFANAVSELLNNLNSSEDVKVSNLQVAIVRVNTEESGEGA